LDEFPLEEIGDRTYLLRAGGGGPKTLLFCCSVTFEEPMVHPLLELMPPVLLVRKQANNDRSLLSLLKMMAAEVVAQRVGGATVLTRLADVVITTVIRDWVATRDEDTSGWLGAIRDPKIGRALVAIHRRPGESWSVESLAKIAQMSRSIFAERFTTLVGIPPAHYLARRRMHLASVWLRDNELTAAEIALRLGYESEPSFSRAFKKTFGVAPSVLRRRESRLAATG
jgi:transcriptional regulator GlxA family with amidase domain